MRLSAAIAFIFTTSVAMSQLAGNYTIDKNSAATSTNFISIASFLDTLHSQGISASITVSINGTSGPYAERIVLDSVSGLSPTKSITIDGGGVTIYDQSTSSRPPIVHLRKMSYVTIKNLKVNCLYNYFSSVGVLIHKSSNFNRIENCEVYSDVSKSPTLNAIEIGEFNINWSASFSTSHGNQIIGCKIQGGLNGMIIAGDTNLSVTTGNRIIDNDVFDFKQRGIGVIRGKNDTIARNQVLRLNRPDSVGMTGIYMSYCYGSNIFENRIYHGQVLTLYDVCEGIYIYKNLNPTSHPTLIFNNIIHGFKSVLQPRGINLSNTSNCKVHFNTIYFDQDASYHYTTGLYVWSSSSTGSPVTISNNIIFTSRKGDGENVSLRISDTSNNVYCDHNVIYAFAKIDLYDRIYTKWAGTEFLSFKEWQAFKGGAYDQHSDSSHPEFLFEHLDSLVPNNVSMNNIGQSVPGISFDYYGQSRDSTPDPGAAEFTPLAADVGLYDTLYQRHCDTITDVLINVFNKGTDTLKSFTFNWQIDNGSINSTIYSASLATDSSLTVTLDSVVNTSEIFVKAWVTNPNGTTDLYAYNDTLIRHVKRGLSGQYTINKNASKSLSNYPSFSSFAFELNRFGVCGPVEVEVIKGSGPYVETATFGEIEGMDSVNTVSIRGHHDQMKLPSNSEELSALIHLEGSDYFHLDSLKFFLPGTPRATAIRLSGASSNNKITRCSIFMEYQGLSSNTDDYGIEVSGTYNDSLGAGLDNYLFKNEIIGGNYGIYVSRDYNASYDRTIIDSNSIGEFRSYGIRCQGLVGGNIRGNNLFKNGNYVYNSSFYGITIYGGGDNNIIGNELTGNSSGNGRQFNGIQVLNSQGYSSSAPTLIANNILYGLKAGNGYYSAGIRIENSQYCSVLHNSIILPYSSSSGMSGITLYQIGQGVEIYNNLIDIHSYYNNNIYCLNYADTSGLYASDNNLLSIKELYGTSGIGRYWNQVSVDLGDWQSNTGLDSNSVETEPLIRNKPYAPHAPLADNRGLNVGVITDFYSHTRHATTPDCGAIEFTADSININVDSVDRAIFGICEEKNVKLKAYVENLGSQTVYNFPLFIDVSVNGDTATYMKFVDSLESYEYKKVLVAAMDTVMTGIMKVRAYISLSSDQYRGDDTTLYITNEVFPYPPTVNIDDTVVCIGDSLIIVPSGNYGPLLWYSSKTSPVPLTLDTALHLNNVKKSKTYFVEGRKHSDDCPGVRTSFKVFVGNTEGADFNYSEIGPRNIKFLLDVPGKANYFLWDFGDGSSSFLSEPLYNYATNGIYTVRLTVSGGCDTTIIEKKVNVGAVTIEEHAVIPTVKLYPNPAENILNIEINELLERNTIQIVDVNGALVIERKIVEPLSRLDLSNMTAGMYFVRILTEEGISIYSEKFIKKE